MDRFRAILPGDYAPIDAVAKTVVKEKQKFERLVMSKEELLEMFKVSLSAYSNLVTI
jgi:threonyl-tRNA synthetase